MKPALRVMLCDDAGERFFGEGPCRLLHLIEETGSLRSAAAQMGLSYSRRCGLCSTPKRTGLCPDLQDHRRAGRRRQHPDRRGPPILERYEAYRDACVQTSREFYSAFFPGQR